MLYTSMWERLEIGRRTAEGARRHGDLPWYDRWHIDIQYHLVTRYLATTTEHGLFCDTR